VPFNCLQLEVEVAVKVTPGFSQRRSAKADKLMTSNLRLKPEATYQMSAIIHLSGHLKPLAGGNVEVRLAGEFATVADALDLLWKEHAALRERVLNEQGEIRQHVNVFADGEDVKRKSGLATKLRSGEIHIFNAVSGG